MFSYDIRTLLFGQAIFSVMPRVKIGNYIFDSQQVLGKGSTGTVYLGLDTTNNSKVAIKVIELKNIDNQVTKYLLKNEIKALQIANHVNVLKAYDVIYDENCCYVITNYCPNNTLEHYIKSRGRIPEEEAIKIFRQIVDGYINLSSNKILHRDLKPSNILFSESFQPVICDFGYCEIGGYLPKPKLHYNVGSPAYMAPESITKNMYSEGSQIWSLGTILYEMLQGRSFSHGREVMEAIMEIKRKGPYSPDGASQFSKKIIRECMALHPNDRMKLHDLKALLSPGYMQSSNRGSVSVDQKQINMRPSTYSVTKQRYNPPLQNLQAVQQMQHQIIPNHDRRYVQTSDVRRVNIQPNLIQIQDPRNTLPPKLNNVTRVRSVHQQHIPSGKIVMQTPPVRLTTLPNTQRPNQNVNMQINQTLQQKQILTQLRQVSRPSTGRQPFRPASNLNRGLTYQSIRQPYQGDSILVNPQDFGVNQSILNTSIRSQSSYYQQLQNEGSILSSQHSGFTRQTVGGNTTKTIQNINANLLAHQNSMRKFHSNQAPTIERSRQSYTTHIPQNHVNQPLSHQIVMAKNVVPQQMTQSKQIHPSNTRQVLHEPQRAVQVQQSGQHNPFLKTAGSKIYSPEVHQQLNLVHKIQGRPGMLVSHVPNQNKVVHTNLDPRFGRKALNSNISQRVPNFQFPGQMIVPTQRSIVPIRLS